jgi:hypothetical protein
MLRACLGEAGLGSSLLTFWDDVAVFSSFRELCSHKIFRGDKGVGSPERPIHRRDKNVESWPVLVVRLCFYLLETLQLGVVVAREKRRPGVDVVIFDRYIYDELANLPLRKWWARGYARIALKLAPQPDVAYLVDADPILARERKPEYPYEFLQRNRAAYIALTACTRQMTTISPSSIAEAQWKVVEELVKKLPNHKREFFSTARTLIDS